jgi:hypothetical protein
MFLLLPSLLRYIFINLKLEIMSIGFFALPGGGGSCNYGIQRVVKEYTTGATWTKPTNLVYLEVFALGAGGGGASGSCRGGGTVSRGGSGGSGGTLMYHSFVHDQLSATEPITIGAGGVGGVGINALATNGNPGSIGGDTTFGTDKVVAKGGNFGTATSGGSIVSIASSTPGTGRFSATSGSGTASSSVGGTLGPGSHSLTTSSINSLFNGGSAGGGINTSGTQVLGGNGGRVYNAGGTLSSVVSGGSAGGGNGNNGTSNYQNRMFTPFIPWTGTGGNGISDITKFPGTGGSGGGSANLGADAAGGNGGNGGLYGGGGAGGGAVESGEIDPNKHKSGNGGNGGNGLVVLIEYIMLCTETTSM